MQDAGRGVLHRESIEAEVMSVNAMRCLAKPQAIPFETSYSFPSCERDE